MATILLVEDDFALAMGTEYALQAEGYTVIHAANLEAARAVFAGGTDADSEEAMNGEAGIDLILLDVMLPDGTGYDFCKEVRSRNQQVPIIFLTAVGEEVNIVQGLELGADDYVAKPYRVKELLSRITACLRRVKVLKDMQEQIQSEMQAVHKNITDGKDHQTWKKDSTAAWEKGKTRYCFGNHRLDIQEFRLYVNETIVDVTPGEFRLLKELIQNDGIVLTRNQLLERLYDTGESFVDDNTLSVYMKRLRDKLGEDAIWIETVRGVGYRFKKREE